MKLILGSKSFGRYDVLTKANYEFKVMVSNFNEESVRSDDHKLLPLLLAREKAKILLPKIDLDSVLITSDQIVVFEGKLREKPKDKDEARVWLNSYSNNYSTAITSVVVINKKTRRQAEGIDIVKVHFKKIPENVIDKIIEKSRVLKTAGAIIGEDPLLYPYIEKLEGDMDSLTGLPLKLTEKLLNEVGFKK